MMKVFLFTLGLIFLSPAAQAAQKVAVVELFTSQGCSSCPPADKFLGELRAHNNVLALAYHVDYWDYIGWTDPYARAAFSNRQRAYARQFNLRYVYTPQMVISGQRETSGNRPARVYDAIDDILNKPMAVTLDMTNGGVEVNGQAQGTLYQVTYHKEVTTDVKRGENRGKQLTEYHIVHDLIALGTWSGGQKRFSLAQMTPGLGHAVFLQRDSDMKILSALKLN